MNLGLSPLAGVGEKRNDPLIERLLHIIFDQVKVSYNFKGLHAFKAKFNPDWGLRYLIYEKREDLPTIGSALLRTHRE